jgi:hypothetical protein
MFWGIALKPGASHTLPEGSDLLHVSQACLADAKEGKCQLQVTDDNTTYTIAVLEKDKSDMASLDLFFNTAAPPTFINKGKSEIHLSGYFEMANDMGSDDESMDEEIESDIEEEAEIDSAAAAKAAIITRQRLEVGTATVLDSVIADRDAFAADVGRIDARAATADARACVQRYAWKLSKGKDDTEVVAAAAVTACDAFIAAATQAEQGPAGAQDLNALQDANVRTMTRWATLYVVQYRADVCD